MSHPDLLLRFHTRSWKGRVPDVLMQAKTQGQSDPAWRDLQSDPEHRDLLAGDRVIDDLRHASIVNLLEDLKAMGYVLSRVHFHELPGTGKGKTYRFTLGFSHRSGQPSRYQNEVVVEWVLRQFATGKMSLLSVVEPKDDGPDSNDAILVNVLDPKNAPEAAPVFQLRLDDDGWWVQDPDDPAGETEVEVSAANLRARRFNAQATAVQKAGEAANGILRAERDMGAAKEAAKEAALRVFEEAGFDDAEVRAQTLVDEGIDWDKKAQKFLDEE